MSRNICFCFTELSIQPQLNSILIPPHARTYTTASSHGETQLLAIHFSLLFSNNDDNNPSSCLQDEKHKPKHVFMFFCFFFFFIFQIPDQIHLNTAQYQDLLTASEKATCPFASFLHTHTYIHAFDNS